MSQQSSPKKTLIPQPARSRSISSSKLAPDKKPDPRRPSPKFGRRAPNRYSPSVTSAKPGARRSSLTTNGLHQNKPAQPVSNKPPPRRPVAGSRIVNPPIKNPPGAKRFVVASNGTTNAKKTPNGLGPKGAQQRAVSTEVLNSPSKIPLRRGSIVNGTKSTSLISLPKATNGESQALVNGKKTPTEENNNNNNLSNGGGALAELLRDASAGTGTSSVVSTTTTTAAQPLQIDAAAIIAERELAVKLAELERTQKQEEQPEDLPPPPKPAPRRQQTQTDLNQRHSKPNSPSAKKKAEEEKARKEQKQQDQKQLQSVRETPSGASTARSTTTGKSGEGTDQDAKSQTTTTTASERGEEKPKHVEAKSSMLQAREISVESLGSARSTDTGVSVDTVKGMSSAREKSGVLTMKKPEAIETLSGNVMAAERNGDTKWVWVCFELGFCQICALKAKKLMQILRKNVFFFGEL